MPYAAERLVVGRIEIVMDPAEKKARADIERFGCHVVHVLAEGDLPAFSYSVGI